LRAPAQQEETVVEWLPASQEIFKIKVVLVESQLQDIWRFLRSPSFKGKLERADMNLQGSDLPHWEDIRG
jgi:hypothetical protein